MNKLLFLVLVVSSLNLKAQVVLIPEKGVSLEIYLAACQKEGYQCSQDYFKQTYMNQKSSAFDQLIETLDLYNEDYRNSLFSKIKTLLAEESLSTEQVDLLIKIITRFESLDKNAGLTEIKNELKELSSDLSNLTEDTSSGEIYILFKRALTKKQYLNIRFKQKYTRTIKITPYTEPTDAKIPSTHYLLTGFCDEYTVSDPIKNNMNLRYSLVFEKDCHSTDVFTQTTSTSTTNWSVLQKPLIYTVVGAALIAVFSKYQLEITY